MTGTRGAGGAAENTLVRVVREKGCLDLHPLHPDSLADARAATASEADALALLARWARDTDRPTNQETDR